MPTYIDAAGCTNTCRHCSREGRPPFGALYSTDQLRDLARVWGPLIIDSEPSAHPDFPEVLDPEIGVCEGVLATNGFGFARAFDPASVFARLREFGYSALSLTLHGAERNHDWFVGRRGAYQDILAATSRAVEAGFGLHWNIYLDRRNLEDVPLLVDLKARMFTGSLWIGVPSHIVNQRLWRYENLRPSARDVEQRLPNLGDLDCTYRGELLTEASCLEMWKNEPSAVGAPETWPPTEPLEKQWAFITRDRRVHLGVECAPRIALGTLDEGRPVIEDRLRKLPAPLDDIDPWTAETHLGASDLLHPSGLSVRCKAVSAAYYWGKRAVRPTGPSDGD